MSVELRFKVNLNSIECCSRKVKSIDEEGNELVHFQYRSIERDSISGSIVTDTGWITSSVVTCKLLNSGVTRKSMVNKICIAVSLSSAFVLAAMFIIS